mgnify:CR=1 FL=1
MTQEPEVGSLAEETLKLLSALGMSGTHSGEKVTCPHGWCPVCRFVEYVTNTPELAEDATEALAKVTSSVMELIKVLHPDTTRE